MLREAKFNHCHYCGVRMNVFKTRTYEMCRTRIYVCPKCNRMSKSVERFRDYDGPGH
ncbi:MAG: hypothetical protein Q4G68_10495 [Planctomycetia bacterium]|nr:hypothetical protein [Planctomycetia bacterium]